MEDLHCLIRPKAHQEMLSSGFVRLALNRGFSKIGPFGGGAVVFA